MADLIEIGVSVVDKGDGLKKAVSTVDRLEAKMTKLIKAQNLGTISTDRFHKAMVIASRELKKNSDLTGNKAYNAIQKYVAAKKAALKAEQDSTKAAQVAAQAIKAAAKAAQDQAKEEERLKNKFVQGYTAMDIYSKELNDLAMARKKDIISTKQQSLAVAALNKDLAAGTGIFASYNNGVNGVKRGTNQLGVMMQQTGYQVGDFFVQVGSGQNIMVAFGQQATQLIGTMAMFAKTTKMIALFSGLGIAIPILTAIGAALMRMRGSAKEATDNIKKLSEELKALVYGTSEEELKFVNRIAAAKLASVTADFNLKQRLWQAGVDASAVERRRAEEAKQEVTAAIADYTRFKDIREGILKIEEDQKALEDRKQAVDDIREAYEAELKLQQEKNVLLQAEAWFGKESVVYKQLAADQARDAYRSELLSENVRGNLLKTLMDEYDVGADLLIQTEAATDATERAKNQAKALADALNDAASAMARLTGFGDSLDVKIAQAAAKVTALQNNANAANAAMSAGLKVQASQRRDEAAAVAVGVDQLRQINAEYDASIAKIGELEGLENTFDSITEANKEAAAAANKSASASEKSAEALKKEIQALELAADATAKYKHEYDKLLKLKDAGLSEQAFAKEVAKLNEELANSSPVLQGFTDAFTNFLSTGANDFKTFANDIIGMFKNMLIKMIAMAAKNKIMLSMGMGGSALATSAAAGNLAGVGSAAGTGAMGSFVGGFGAAGGAAGTGLLGGMGSVASGVMSGGLAGGASAIGTALSGATAGMAGFGAAIGAVALPLLAVTAVFSFFKKKTKELDSGLNVTVKNMDTFVESFSKVQTSKFWGLSKSESTTTSAASDAVANPIIAAVSEIQNQVVKAADALGIASDAFEGFSYDFKLSLKGLTEEQAMAKINEELVKMGDSFASMTGLFSTMNELLAVTQQRMDLETKLLNMQGNVVELRKQELDAVHILNKGLAARIQLLEAEADMSSALAAFASGISQQQGVIKSAVDALISPLLEAINRVKTQAEASYKIFSEAADKTRVEAKTIVDLLRGALDARTIKSEGLELMRYKQAQRQLAAFAGGAAFDKASLSKATEGVSIDSQKFFGSFEDYARDFYKTQINLEQLEKKASEQLTDVEKQIELAEKAYETAMGTYEEAVDTNKALKTLLEDLAAYTEVAARNEPFIDQIKAEGDRQVELLDQILKETTLQVNGLLGIETSVADLVGSNLSVGEALEVLGLSGKELVGAVLALDNPVAEIGNHVKDLNITFIEGISGLGAISADLKLGLVGVNGTIGLLKNSTDAQANNILTLNGTVISNNAVVNSLTGAVIGFGTYIASLGTSTNTLGININNLGGTIGAALNGLGSTVSSLSGGFNGLVNSNNNLIAAINAAAAASAASAGAAAGAGGSTAPAQKTITIKSTFKGGADFLRDGASGVVLSDGRKFKTEKGWGDNKEIDNAMEMARKAVLKDGNIPAFANGGMHSGGLRLVGENGPELEATGPSRIYSNQQTKGLMSNSGSSETVAELRMLRQEISEMKAEQRKIGVENVKYNKKSYDLNRQWDVVGLPATRTS